DLRTLSLSGPPAQVLVGVARYSAGGLLRPQSFFAASATGTLAYRSGPASTVVGQAKIILSDLDGRDNVLDLPPAPYVAPRVSSDGKLLAVGTDDGTAANVWIHDFSRRSALRRLTFNGRNGVPVWSPDGQRIAMQSNRDGDVSLYLQRV